MATTKKTAAKPAAKPAGKGVDLLGAIRDASRELVKLERTREEYEKRLAEVKGRIDELQTKTLVTLMQEADCTMFELGGGFKVERSQEHYANISKERSTAAYAWLEKHNFGGLIKVEVSANFGKGQLKQAEKLVKLAREHKYILGLSRSVHPQTLKAFVREQLEKGAPLDMELFGVHTVDKVVLKQSK